MRHTGILDVVNPPGGEVLETPGAYTYQTGTNKLSHITATPPFDYGYDADGNITSENTRTFVYDLSNQLIQVLDGSTQTAAYTYNGAGQRIKKVTQTETRIFHYDLKGHLIAETNQTGQMLAEYIYLGDQLLSMIKPGESVYYFHNDHLGTPQVLTDDSQAIAWKAVYTPFGEGVTSVATVENPFRFPGQYYDPETGLHYNYFRYYNPQTGRYITPDPIGLEGGINLFVYVDSAGKSHFDTNLYTYVANNPINRMDSWGLVSVILPENPWSWQPAAGSRAQYVTVLDPGSMDPTMRWDSTKEYGIGPDNFPKAFLQGIAQLGFEIVDFFFNRMLWPSAEQLKEQLEHFSGRPAEACPSKK